MDPFTKTPRKCEVSSDTPDDFKDFNDKELIESVLYTSQNMFGEVQFEAECELMRRFPRPDWAKGKV